MKPYLLEIVSINKPAFSTCKMGQMKLLPGLATGSCGIP
jgi:hypothetical protein